MTHGPGEEVTPPGDALRAAFDASAAGLVVCEGPDLLIRAINGAARGLAHREDILGLPLHEAFADMSGQGVLELYDEVFRTGQPAARDGWRLQVDAEDGGRAEFVARFEIQPWWGDDGSMRGTVTTVTDVTATVHAADRAEKRYEDAADLVRTMQEVLLPDDLPVLAQVQVDASYLLAVEDASAGGDWYDVVVRPSGRIALMVGDVVGHGVAASAVMGQLRAVLHERLLEDTSLDSVIATLDRVAARRVESLAATLCVVELDPDSGDLTYVTAGHPPPLVVDLDGVAQFWPVSGAAPLGVGPAPTSRRAHLDEGEVVVLYTDGAIERPGRDPATAREELREIVSDAVLGRALSVGSEHRPTERVCSDGLELLARRSGHTDDITLLAASRAAAPERLVLDLPAEVTSLPACRRHLDAWLKGLGARGLDVVCIQHAVGELVENAIEHAYVDAFAAQLDPYAIRVEAEMTPGGEAVISVTDRGHWREPGHRDHHGHRDDRGRGLSLVRGFTDAAVVAHDDQGTRVTLHHQLTRPARFTSSAIPAESHPGAVFSVHAADDVVHVRGPVDSKTTDELRVALDRATHGGTRQIEVELSEVTHLGSPGVQLLYEVRRDDVPVVLTAKRGCVADQVLSLVQLDHRTPD